LQARAILEAAVNVSQAGVKVHPHIMIPLVGIEDELIGQAKIVRQVAEEVFAGTGQKVDYKIGTMIEVPRGALRAGDLAKTAEFFSFGTNDLTQMTFGISRDDAQAKFLQFYTKNGLLVRSTDCTASNCCLLMGAARRSVSDLTSALAVHDCLSWLCEQPVQPGFGLLHPPPTATLDLCCSLWRCLFLSGHLLRCGAACVFLFAAGS
jgi:citrate lyase beta subunit